MKYLLILLLFSSCTTPRLGVKQETTVSVQGKDVIAVIYPANSFEAYGYMKMLKKNGYDCNKENTECEGENVYIYRVFDKRGEIYLIVKRK